MGSNVLIPMISNLMLKLSFFVAVMMIDFTSHKPNYHKYILMFMFITFTHVNEDKLVKTQTMENTILSSYCRGFQDSLK